MKFTEALNFVKNEKNCSEKDAFNYLFEWITDEKLSITNSEILEFEDVKDCIDFKEIGSCRSKYDSAFSERIREAVANKKKFVLGEYYKGKDGEIYLEFYNLSRPDGQSICSHENSFFVGGPCFEDADIRKLVKPEKEIEIERLKAEIEQQNKMPAVAKAGRPIKYTKLPDAIIQFVEENKYKGKGQDINFINGVLKLIPQSEEKPKSNSTITKAFQRLQETRKIE